MRDSSTPAALQNIEHALALLDRVSRFLTIGDAPAGDPLEGLNEATACLAKAREALVS